MAFNKRIKKKLNAKSKKKGCEIIADWVESTSNHFWWSLASCSGNPDDLVERFQSIIFHVINKHHWPGAVHFKQCAHEKIPDTPERRVKWMKAGSTAHDQFKKIIMHSNVRKDLHQMTGGIHTTLLEVYYNVIAKYLPKIYHFGFDHMEIGTMLASLDNNNNTGDLFPYPFGSAGCAYSRCGVA